MAFSFEQLILLIILALVVALLYGIRRIYVLEQVIRNLELNLTKKVKRK